MFFYPRKNKIYLVFVAALFCLIFTGHIDSARAGTASVPYRVDGSGDKVYREASTTLYPGLNFSEADLSLLRYNLDFYQYYYHNFRSTMVAHWSMENARPFSDRVNLESLGPIYSDNAQLALGLLKAQSSGDTVDLLVKQARDKTSRENLAKSGADVLIGQALDTVAPGQAFAWLVDVPLEAAYIMGTATLSGLNDMMDNYYRGFGERELYKAWEEAGGEEIYAYGTRNGVTGQLISSLESAVALIDTVSYQKTAAENGQVLEQLTVVLNTQKNYLHILPQKASVLASRVDSHAPVAYWVTEALQTFGLNASATVNIDGRQVTLTGATLLNWKNEVKGLEGLARLHGKYLAQYLAAPYVAQMTFVNGDYPDTPGVDHYPVLNLSGLEAVRQTKLLFLLPDLSRRPLVTAGLSGDYPSIQEAVDNCPEGGAVEVRAGTYGESVIIDKSIAIYAATPGEAVLKPGNTAFGIKITADGVICEGIKIEGSVQGLVLENCQDCVIAQNQIEGSIFGIMLRNVFDSEIAGNDVAAVRDTGLTLTAGGGNKLWYNHFGPQAAEAANAYDGGHNSWDDGEAGNLWSDYGGTGSYTISGGRQKDDKIYGGVLLREGASLTAQVLVEGLFTRSRSETAQLEVDFYFGVPADGVLIDSVPVEPNGLVGLATLNWNTFGYIGAQDIYAVLDDGAGGKIKQKVDLKPAGGTYSSVNLYASEFSIADAVEVRDAQVTWVPSPYVEEPDIDLEEGASFSLSGTTFNKPVPLRLAGQEIFRQAQVVDYPWDPDIDYAFVFKGFMPAAETVLNVVPGRIELHNTLGLYLEDKDFPNTDFLIEHPVQSEYRITDHWDGVSAGDLSIKNSSVSIKDTAAGILEVTGGPSARITSCTAQEIHVRQYAEDVWLEDNTVTGGGIYGIEVSELTGSPPVRVRGNTVTGSNQAIKVAVPGGVIYLENNEIDNCVDGLDLSGAGQMNITGNILSNLRGDAVCISSGTRADIMENTISNVQGDGLSIAGLTDIWAHNNNLTGGYPELPAGTGIRLTGVHVQNGLDDALYYGATGSEISLNRVVAWNRGIELVDCSKVTTALNNFVDNDEAAYDDSTTGANDWDRSSLGNYWSDWNCSGNPSTGQPRSIPGGSGVDRYPYQDQNGWGITDSAAPVISDFQVELVDADTAVVTWTTDEGADSYVNYYPQEQAWNEDSASDGRMKIFHSLVADNLISETVYVFKARSTDRAHNSSAVAQAAVTTPDMTPPEVTYADPVNTGHMGAEISWSATEEVKVEVQYGTGSHSYHNSREITGLQEQGTVTLDNLEPATTYYGRFLATDAAGNQTVAEEFSFTTRSLPVVIISPVPEWVYPGVAIEFDAVSSFDAEGAIDNVVWDFGDGTMNEDGLTVTHAYGELTAGTHEVKATVYDDNGGVNTATVTVTSGRVIEVVPEAEADPAGHVWPTIIQALEDAVPGDCIEIYAGQFDSKTYQENLVLDIPVFLRGRYTTNYLHYIDGDGHDAVITLNADQCRLEGLHIQGGAPAVRINSSGNVIKSNTFENNAAGIFLAAGSSSNLIEGNKIINSVAEAVYGTSVPDNSICSNQITANSGTAVALTEAPRSSIKDNRIDGGLAGIRAEGTQLEIAGNTVSLCTGAGIRVSGAAAAVTGNYVNSNGTGIQTDNTDNAIICGNYFWDNGHNAVVGAEAENRWNNDLRGNYWDDYTGSDTDLDGIGDQYYQVAGSGQYDEKPLMEPVIPDNEAPVIAHNSRQLEAGTRDADLTWETDEMSVGAVYYGTGPDNLQLMTTEEEFSVVHKTYLSGLEPGTTYYYQIVARDVFDNERVVFDDDYVFTTRELYPPNLTYQVTPQPSWNAPVYALQEITFDAGGSFDTYGEIVNYLWDFGDGTEIVDAVATTHAYSKCGEYTVNITIRDNDGLEQSADIILNITNNQPQAAFAFTPASPLAAREITFDASASQDPDGSITGYAWEFGDGESGEGMQVKHTYLTTTYNGDPYRCKLIVTDDDGGTGEVTVEVPVANHPPVADLVITPGQISVGDTVTFDAGGSEDPDGAQVSYRIEQYAWDFGDGTTETTDWSIYDDGSTVTHQYAAAGTYHVSVTVFDVNEAADTAEADIVVQDTSAIPVTGVTLDRDTLVTDLHDDPVQLTATVAPANAANQNVAWSSDNLDVAMVNGTGIVSQVGTGQANITVSTEDGGFTDTCTVTVTGGTGPAPLSLAPSNLPEGYGDTAMTLTDATTVQDTWTVGESLDVRVMIVDDPLTPPEQEAAVDITSFTVNENTVALTMPAGLAAGNYVIQVLRGDAVIAAGALPVIATAPQVANIVINGSDTLTIPDSGTVSGQYTAVVEDVYGRSLPGETAGWSLAHRPVGIGLNLNQDNSVTVNVESYAAPGVITLQAVADSDPEVVSQKTINITPEAAEVIYGDVTGDGNVWPNDATAVLRNFVGLEAFDSNQVRAGDVTGDGNIWPNDATAILRYFVGLDSSFAVEQ